MIGATATILLSSILLVICLDASPIIEPACPDECSKKLEPRRNLTRHTQEFEVTKLAATCGFPSNDDFGISWEAPNQDSDLVAGYRVHWYTTKLYCKCLPKSERAFIISNGTKGWVFPRHISFMVKPLPRPKPQETFKLLSAHCMKESKNSTIHPEEAEPKTEEIEIRYIAVSIGVAVGVFLTLVSYVLWSRVYKNKHHADPPEADRQKLLHMVEDPVYVSYHASDQDFTARVHGISCWLIEQGVHTIMDRMFSCEIAETGIIEWCEQQMARAKKVLIVCSSSFLKVCKLREQQIQGEKDVAQENLTSEKLQTLQEIALIKREMFLSGYCADKFIVVLLGVEEEKLPAWLREFPVFSWPQERDNLVALIKDQEVKV